MKTEAEIRKKVEELKEKMKAIKAKAREETYGVPNYKNHLIYYELMKDVMREYGYIATLLWVLGESVSYEIDILTRLDPCDEERIRELLAKRRR